MKKIWLFSIILIFPLTSVPQNLDEKIFRNINDSHSSFADGIIKANDATMFPIAFGLPFVFAGYGKIYNKNYAFDTGLMLMISEGATFSVFFPIKYSVNRKRPFDALPPPKVRKLANPKDPSFPSGHSAGSFAVATSLTLRYKTWKVAVPAYLWAGLMAYGRIYQGVHYPSDVLVGSLIGILVPIIIHDFESEIIEFRKKFLTFNDEKVSLNYNLNMVSITFKL
jgi:undecaprenyl-diphosphatase